VPGGLWHMFLLNCSRTAGENSLLPICQVHLRGKCTGFTLEELDEEEKIWKKSQNTKMFG